MDDDLAPLVERVEAATRRHRDSATAMAGCGCRTRCAWCRATRLVAHAELVAALEQLEAAEGRLLAERQPALRGA